MNMMTCYENDEWNAMLISLMADKLIRIKTNNLEFKK